MGIRIKIIFLVFAYFLFTPVSDGATLVKPLNNLGLVGYWSFNEGTSTVATDFSGSGNQGTLNTFSAPATASSGWAIGKFGNALHFDGGSDYVQVGQDIYDSLNVGTISAWIRFDVDPGTDTARVIFGGASSSCSTCFFVFRIFGISASDTRLGVGSRIGDEFMHGDTQLEPNTWYHVAVTSDGATYKLYVNGVLQSITIEFGANNGAWFSDNVSGTDNYSVGVLRRSSGNIEYFDGRVDEVRVYNRELTATEITALYNTGLIKINSSQSNILTRGLVGLWTFDGGDILGSTIYDRSSNGTQGLINETSRTLGKLGQALYFDGSNDYVDTNYRWSASDTSMTISQWIKSTATAYSNIVANYDGLGSTIETLIENGNYKSFIRGSNSANVNPSSTATVNDGQWHHVVTVVSGTVATQYIDGVQDGTANNNSLDGNYDSGSDLFIGQDALGANDFAGSIDDVRIYNRALSLSEIKTLYNMAGTKINTSRASPPGTTLGSGLVGYWSFNGLDFSDAVYDRSGNGNNGYLWNGPTTTARVIGKSGQGVAFDGTDDMVHIGDPASGVLDFEYTQPFSLSYWINRSSAGTTMGPVYKRTSSGNGYNMEIFSDNTIRLTLATNAGSNEVITVGTNSTFANTGQWYHIVGTYSGSGTPAGFKIYVNGVDQALTTLVNNLAPGTTLTTTAFTIGARGSGAERQVNGKMDEVRVYNRVLSATEVKQLYDFGR